MRDRPAFSRNPLVRVDPADAERLCGIAEEFPRGCNIVLGRGEYLLPRLLVMPSNTTLCGEGPAETHIVLAEGANSHVIATEKGRRRTHNLVVSRLSVHGNAKGQSMPKDHPRISYACGIFFELASSILVEEVRCEDIRQTALHLSACMNAVIRDVSTHRVGWSGLGGFATTNLWISGASLFDSGLEDKHSAVHLAACTGVYLDATIERATGNGVMLDSIKWQVSHCEVRAEAKHCGRGLAVIGLADKPAESLLISGSFNENREGGVMISNARSVVLSDCQIRENGEFGLLLQGRIGATDCLIAADCDISGNPVDISSQHASGSNWIFDNPLDPTKPSGVAINDETMQRRGSPPGVWAAKSVKDWFG